MHQQKAEPPRFDAEQEPYVALRTKALESLLIEKGVVTEAVVDAIIEYYEQDIGPLRGAQIIVRAWVDPAFKQRLLSDGAAALGEFDIPSHAPLLVVENTPTDHNVVVCTLCSCYPWSVLGLPPTWYKSVAYRSRVVIEPRVVLQEFGLELDDDIHIQVWDSSADQRYLVLPERPPGTEHLSEQELAALVTRDTMIGVARVQASELVGTN